MAKLMPVAVHTLLLREEEIFLLKRANTGFQDGNWGLVAGHLEQGETVRQAAVRECQEEVGVDIALADLEVVGVEHYYSATTQGIDFYCKSFQWQGRPYAKAECDEVAWFKLNDLPSDTIPFTKDAIQRVLLGKQWFSEISAC